MCETHDLTLERSLCRPCWQRKWKSCWQSPRSVPSRHFFFKNPRKVVLNKRRTKIIGKIVSPQFPKSIHWSAQLWRTEWIQSLLHSVQRRPSWKCRPIFLQRKKKNCKNYKIFVDILNPPFRTSSSSEGASGHNRCSQQDSQRLCWTRGGLYFPAVCLFTSSFV